MNDMMCWPHKNWENPPKPGDTMSPQPPFKSASLDDWHKAATKSAPGGDVQGLNWVTPDGITVKPLYTAEDTRDLPYANTLPGFEPFLRGPQATMYAVRPWTIRQYAGFSTAEKVTNVSGRGVGMDVVRTNIEKIGGVIELDSKWGEGTTFTIKIPLTLAIVSALIVSCGDERFAIPQISVVELVQARIDGARANDAEALNTAPNRPANNMTASTEFFTSFGSSPNAK